MPDVITATTIGGIDLNPASEAYTTIIRPGQLRLRTADKNPHIVQRTARGTKSTGSIVSSRTMIVDHEIATDSHEANLATLGKIYDLEGEQTLVFSEDGTAKQVTVVVKRMIPHQSGLSREVVSGEWELLSDLKFENVADSVAGVSKSASPATLSVANGGNAKSPEAVITLKPTAQKAAADGQRYSYPITPVNRSSRPLVNYPLCLTNGVESDGSAVTGWDHAAEVTATRSAADGDDVEIYVNGRRTSRWDDPNSARDFNSATTYLWANVDMPAARYWTLRAALATTATTIKVEEPLRALPETPFYVAFDESAQYEIVRVTAYDEEKKELTIVRGQRGTSDPGSNHGSGTKLYWCPVLIDLVYGWTGAPSPDWNDDDYKPMMIEASAASVSDNGIWRFAEFQETDATADTQSRKPRSASWRTRGLAAYERDHEKGEGDIYPRYIPRTATLTTDAAVATKMCLAYRNAGALSGHPLSDRWELYSPIGITQVKFDQITTDLIYSGGNKEARLSVEGVGADGAVEVLGTYEDSSTTETLTPTHPVYLVRFRVEVWDPKIEATVVSDLASEPTDADGIIIDNCELTFATAEEPLVIWSASRRNIYQLGRPDEALTLANSDGDTLSIWGLVVALNDTVDIDVVNQEITIDDGIRQSHLATGVYPEIPTGTNDLTLTELASGDVMGTILFGVSSHRDAWV